MEKETIKMINDSIVGRPQEFTIDGKEYALWPVTLGVSILMSEYMEALDFDEYDTPNMQMLDMMRVCHEHKMDAARCVAVHTFEDAREARSAIKVNARAKEIADGTDSKELAELLMAVLMKDQGVAQMCKDSGIDKDNETLRMISEHKADKGGTKTFGGHTKYGQLIVPACEINHCDADKVIWGISLVQLQMMLADRVNTIFQTEKDEVINGDDPGNAERIREIFKDN